MTLYINLKYSRCLIMNILIHVNITEKRAVVVMMWIILCVETTVSDGKNLIQVKKNAVEDKYLKAVQDLKKAHVIVATLF